MWQVNSKRAYSAKSVFISRDRGKWDWIVRSWWMLLFWGICFGLYSHAVHKKKVAYSELKQKITELESAKQLLLAEKEDLLLQIHSQNDEAWTEMVLKKKLGLVPAGQQKVYFQQDSD